LVLALFGWGLASPVRAQGVGPRLLFTDIESGPGTGGQDNLGAFITIYGEGFGATQGSSTVTVGGKPVARVISWGENNAAARSMDRIVVQPGPGAISGDIKVSSGSRTSNGLPFTVRTGNIYFVNQTTGADSNPGTYAQPWATIWRPRQTVVAGDIVYVQGGTFSTLDPAMPGWDTLVFLDTSLCATGTAAAPIAYLGYPGNPPRFANAAARRGIYLNQDSGPLSYYVIGNVLFGEMIESILVTGIGHRIVGNDLHDGGVGDKVGVFGNTSAIRILGNRFDSNGTPETKYYAIYVQGFGVNRDIDIGWNEVRDQEGRSIQVYGHAAGDIVDDLRIHDNVLMGSDLNNLLLGGSDGGTEILGTVSVTGNVIVGSRSAEGLRVNDPGGTVTIENNTIAGNAVAQVYIEEAGAGRVTLRNNIIVAGPGQQYYEFDAGSSPASVVPSRNLVYGAGACEVWDTGCVNQDPHFASATDYHLQAGSPAIDAGVPTSALRDHDGTPRPQGAAFDIGAFEYVGSSGSCVLNCSATVPGTGVAGGQVAFEATATASGCSGEPAYSWQLGDGAHATSKSVSHVYASAGSYAWSLTVSVDGQLCTRGGTIVVSGSTSYPFRYLVPAVVHAGGGAGTNWRTSIAALNPGQAEARLELSLRTASDTTSRTARLSGGATIEWEDIVVRLFGADPAASTAGALEVAADSSLLLTSRTYNQVDAGTYGQYLPALTATDALGAGATGYLLQVKRNAGFRTNVGFANLLNQECQVRLRLLDDRGVQIGSSRTVTVPARGWVQENDVFILLGAGERDLGIAVVEPLTAGGAVWAYASIVDYRTGDATTIPVQRE
jgi:PKD repeat protein